MATHEHPAHLRSAGTKAQQGQTADPFSIDRMVQATADEERGDGHRCPFCDADVAGELAMRSHLRWSHHDGDDVDASIAHHPSTVTDLDPLALLDQVVAKMSITD